MFTITYAMGVWMNHMNILASVEQSRICNISRLVYVFKNLEIGLTRFMTQFIVPTM